MSYMRIFIGGMAAGVALCLLLALVAVSIARADHRVLFGDDVYGEYDIFNRAIADLRETGQHRWYYEQDSSGLNIEPQVQQAYREYEEMFRFDAVQTAGQGYGVFASGGAEYKYGNRAHAGCAEWSVGCLPAYASNPYIVMESLRMVTGGWANRSIIEVSLHEIGHQLGNFAEQYQESYVYGATACTNKNYTVMDCGLFNAQFLGDFEFDAWVASHKPAPVAGGGIGTNAGGTYVFYGQSNYKAVYVSIMVRLPDGRYRWTGIHAPLPTGSKKWQGWHLNQSTFDLPAGSCIYIAAENRVNFRIGEARVDRLVGCLSSPVESIR